MGDPVSFRAAKQPRGVHSGAEPSARLGSAGSASRFRRPGRPRGRNDAVGNANPADTLTAAALELFAERNFASVTIRDIARATGVNSAMIYYYFGSKHGLFLQTIEHAVEEAFGKFEQREADTSDPVQTMTSWMDNHLRLYDTIHKLVKISLDYKGSTENDPAVDGAIQKFYDQEHQLLAGCIRAGVKKKLFKPVRPEKVAQFISTYLDGAMVRAVILPQFDLEGAVADLRGITWELLGYKPVR